VYAAAQDRVLETLLAERRADYEELEEMQRALLGEHGQCVSPPPVDGSIGTMDAGAIDNSDAEGSEEEVVAQIESDR
jgi:hypothetical protein